MTEPLSVNVQAHTDVEVNDSCNCCIPFRKKDRKDSRVIITTDETYHKTITREETQVFPMGGIEKGSHTKSGGHSKSSHHRK